MRWNSRGGGNNLHSLTQNFQTSADRCEADASSVRCRFRDQMFYSASVVILTTGQAMTSNISTVFVQFTPYVISRRRTSIGLLRHR